MGYDWFKPFIEEESRRKWTQCWRPFEARTQTINRKTVDTFFNMLEKLAAYNNLSDTPGNIFNIDESSILMNKELYSGIREKSL